MATKKIFISFDYENDQHYKNLLIAWSQNPAAHFAEFYINDHSVTTPVDSVNAGPIKGVITRKITDATGFLCIIGKQTHRSKWIRWEIDKAVELRKKIIAVKIEKDNSVPDNIYGVGAAWALSFTLDAIRTAIDEAYS
jgi:hypothetical protein